ncbi:MAG: Gfo/Idh/MocA family protein [Tepidisphaerales bacterium]
MAQDSISRRGILKSTVAAAVATQLAIPPVHAAGSAEIRVGVVGCGARGRGAAAQAVASADGVRITSLADLFADSIQTTQAGWANRPRDKYAVPRERCFVGWDAYKELLATDVDYVLLTTPAAFRPMHMRAAIDAGKHVYLEKGIAVDPVGVRTIIAASEDATRKKLAVVSGTWRRHDKAYVETIRRVRDGAIGRIIAGKARCLQQAFQVVTRKEGWSDMEWQIRNFHCFTWVSGDIIVDQHIHQLDIANQILGGPPLSCVGTGGRQVHTDPAFGNMFDHFAVDYVYANQVPVASMCRQIDGTYNDLGEWFYGTRGQADISQARIRIDGGPNWQYRDPPNDPWKQIHADLIASVRAGNPINDGKEVALSHLTAIMGRMSAYSGQQVRLEEAMASNLDLMPKKLELGPLPIAPVAMPGRREP